MTDIEIVIAALREVALNIGCNSDDLSDRLSRMLETLADTIQEMTP